MGEFPKEPTESESSQEIKQELNEMLESADGSWSVYVYSFDQAEAAFEYGRDKVFEAASINKLPIGLYALSQVEEGKIGLDDELEVTEERKRAGTGILRLLREGLNVTVEDALTLMMAVSDNTAAKLMVGKAGPENINQYLEASGLAETRLEVLPEGTFSYGYTTAKESAQLLGGIYNAEYVSPEASQKLLAMRGHNHFSYGTGRYLPKNLEVANKEGSLEDSRHEVAVVNAQRPYAICVFADELADQSYHVDNAGVLQRARIAEKVHAFMLTSDKST
jgi:beta-lactamase class A